MENDVGQVVAGLHPLEIRVLRTYRAGDVIDSGILARDLAYKTGQTNQTVSWLSAKNLIREQARVSRVLYELTELGLEYGRGGTPEEKILRLVREKGAMRLPEIARELSLDNKDVGSAFGALSKDGVLCMDADKKAALCGEGCGPSPRMVRVRAIFDRALLNTLAVGGGVLGVGDGSLAEGELSAEELELIQSMSKKRGAASSPFKTVEREEVSYILLPGADRVRGALEAAGISGEETGTLTAEMLVKGTWKNIVFRRYSVDSPAPRMILGRTNAYCDFLRSVKDKLSALGFEEFDGPLVETEFWNSDALFMPQFHSARDIHDVYYLKNPTHAKRIEQPYLDQVASAHENGWTTGSRGWEYSFNRDFTRRLILRSQGTVLSAKQLPRAKVPGKYFGIVRCFRYDQVDATHLSDFYQTEGIAIGESVNLKTHLGFLRMFAEEVAGASEVKYVPGYFPFTEPSIEVHIKHPVLGWFELGGSGIFRPEVTEALGIHAPVLAWGIGIDRMALMSLGVNDLRELFSVNLENVRLCRSK
ncbi:MAG: phenylalanine--tRNA ligase subunit alpha [Spirochaetales bacterium]|jgi:phenylalanyl-tRNA synthetase alpha chain|nr:phenylalanine--tRNA ligase subunit alpha [Spirochaetales bacterium]